MFNELIVFVILITALHKNNVLSLFYVFLAVLMVLKSTTTMRKIKIFTVVAFFMVF